MQISPGLFAVLVAPWVGAAGAVVAFLAARTAWPKFKPRGAVIPGKYTVEMEGEFVVFIIGMYLGSPWEWLWSLPTVIAANRGMSAMLAELEAEPEHGCLLVSHSITIDAPPAIVQIWRSTDHLNKYARNRMAKHLGTWLKWNADAKSSKGGLVRGVGIYHETYTVKAGAYEAVYVNMPATGLARARAGKIVDASHGRMRTAQGRLGQTDGGDHAEVGAY